ncbi:MAG TPA: TIGR02757 family protein [Vicinamibacterales bacterium]
MEAHPLKVRLDQLYQSYNCVNAATDPIEIVRRYPDRSDREVVGFVSASLAFGRVASVLQSIERVLQVLGPSPAEFVSRFEPARHARRLHGIVHRWTRGVDLAALLWITRAMLEHGSIEAFFLEGSDTSATDVSGALDSFSTRAMSVDLRPVYGRVPRRPGVQYFFPKPSAGSGCKRLNLFLRWMVRHDEVDLGVWSHLSPSKLVMPLDTHVIRVGRCLGLTTRKSPGWRMAAEITASLRALDPADPVKYDFSLCHIGMANACSFNHQQSNGLCPLAGHCAPHGRSARRSRTPSRSPQPSARR